MIGLSEISSGCVVLVWQEHNTHTFENKERSLDLLKSLLLGTLFQWSRVWGYMQCISIHAFLLSVRFTT